MSKSYIPQNYHTPLSVYEMQRAIEFIKSNFQVNLSKALNLRRVSAPLFVDENSGLNDNLNGVERPVSFDIPDVGTNAQVVQSLAKWKRMALYRYDFYPGKGLYTDMTHLSLGIINNYNAQSLLCKGFSNRITSKIRMHTLLLKRASI